MNIVKYQILPINCRIPIPKSEAMLAGLVINLQIYVEYKHRSLILVEYKNSQTVLHTFNVYIHLVFVTTSVIPCMIPPCLFVKLELGLDCDRGSFLPDSLNITK